MKSWLILPNNTYMYFYRSHVMSVSHRLSQNREMMPDRTYDLLFLLMSVFQRCMYLDQLQVLSDLHHHPKHIWDSVIIRLYIYTYPSFSFPPSFPVSHLLYGSFPSPACSSMPLSNAFYKLLSSYWTIVSRSAVKSGCKTTSFYVM